MVYSHNDSQWLGKAKKVKGRIQALTEKGGTFIWVGGPAAGHDVYEGLSAGSVCGQTVWARVGSRTSEDAEHDLHGIGGIWKYSKKDSTMSEWMNVVWRLCWNREVVESWNLCHAFKNMTLQNGTLLSAYMVLLIDKDD